MQNDGFGLVVFGDGYITKSLNHIRKFDVETLVSMTPYHQIHFFRNSDVGDNVILVTS